MSILEKTSNFNGIWKFSNIVPLTQLEEMAKDLAQNTQYISIHIRGCSKEQFGIAFEYKPTEGETFPGFSNKMTDMFKRKTGNGLVGWDTSAYFYKIK